MRIILLNTPFLQEKITRDMAGGLGFTAVPETVLPPIDLALIASILRKRKHRVRIIDPEVNLATSAEVVREILDWNPKMVIASVSLPSLKSDIQFLKKLKAKFSGKLILRTSITFEPILKEILKESGGDLCFFGEVNLGASKVIEEGIGGGVAYFKDRKFFITPQKYLENLNQLPLPARDLLENQFYHYSLLGKNCTIIQTSRGCPFPCAYYCPYPLVQGRKWRAMSPRRVYKELYQIVKKYKIDKVLFRDATFTLDKRRTIEICRLIIKNKLKFSWWCETRVNCLDRELLLKMKKAGCMGINIGVETGDPEVMKIQGKPGVDLDLLENLKENADEVGVKLHFLLLVGLPQETRNSVYLTFKLVKKLRPSSMGVTVITPYPGTELYYEAKKKGWIETEDWSKYSGDLPVMHTDNFSLRDIKMIQKLIQAELFFLKKGILGKTPLLFEEILFKIWKRL